MKNKPTIRTLARRSEALLACRTLEDVAGLLGVRPERILTLAAGPQYREFQVPKKNGSMRQIEDPVPPLKRIQDYLADFLQAVYYFHRTPAAYGFMLRPVDDPEPRHVLSNAEKHLGRPWLLNLDMQDFFHAVTIERVREVLEAPLFGFPEEISAQLAQLTTYQGRLPMGAPSSPVLSNLASIPLDQDLQDLAEDRNWVYTRYADDLSFSADRPFEPDAIDRIAFIAETWGFRLNPKKNKHYGPGDRDKQVTGLLVSGDKVDLPDDYLPTLEAAIAHLSKVVDAQHLVSSGRNQPDSWVMELRRGVYGKLEFARHILGADHHWVSRLSGNYYDAIRPPEEYGALSWLEFGYDWDVNAGW